MTLKDVFQELLQVVVNVLLTILWVVGWFVAVLIIHYMIFPFSGGGIFIHAAIVALSVILANVTLELMYDEQRFVRFHLFLSIFVAYLVEMVIYSINSLLSATPLF